MKLPMSIGLASASLFVIAATAHAQTESGASAKALELEEIVVTARRTEERLQDVPISMTVFSQQQLTERNIVTATDLSTYTPSLSATNRFGSDNASFAIRGFTQEGPTSPSVAVYFADVVALRAQAATTIGNGAGPGSFFDLQNVQVLKGPQGTLFGRNTTGGAILLVPQKPTHNLEGYVEATGGNYNERRFQGVANIPFTDNLRFRIGIDTNKRDGWQKNRSGIGPDNFSDVNYTAIRASLVADITPNLENYLIASYADSDTNGGMPKVTNCYPGSGLLAGLACAQIARQSARGDSYWDVDNGFPQAKQHSKQWQAINTTTWKATDQLTVKNIISYGEFREQFASAIFGENFPGVPIHFVYLGNFPGIDNASQSTFTEELQLQGRAFNDKLQYQAGVYGEFSEPIGANGSRASLFSDCSDVTNLQCSSGAFFFGFVNSNQVKTTFRNLGVYSQATYQITDQFSVTGGLRYTSDTTKSEDKAVTYNFPTPNNPVGTCSDVVFFNTPPGTPAKPAPNEDVCRASFVEKSKKPTWLLDFDYKPTQDILVYLKYARGYRQGGVDPTKFGFPTWGPEKVDSYELGSKLSWSGVVPGAFNVAVFHNDFSDQQLQTNAIPLPNVTGVGTSAGIFNAGKSKIDGLEADTSITPVQGLTLNLAYAYLKTKVEEITVPQSTIFQFLPTANLNEELIYSPKNKYTANLNYKVPFIPEDLGNVAAGVTFTHTDEQKSSGPAATPLYLMPAVNLIGANASWNNIAQLPLDVALYGTNLANKKYPVSVAGAFSQGFESLMLGEPRIWGVRVKYRFGGT